MSTHPCPDSPEQPNQVLFTVEMNWGQQPVRLTAWCCDELPVDAPTTSVHIAALYGSHLLVVRDRKGVYGFPGGRLNPGETREQAMAREVYEEANAYLEDGYILFGVIKIEYTARVPGRAYPHEFSYLAMYAGRVRSLDPFNGDPAGIIHERALFSLADCRQHLLDHDQILMEKALEILLQHGDPQAQAFLHDQAANGPQL